VAMHNQYRHLSRDERCKIMFMSRWGKRIAEIAAELGRSRSTISRELRRNVSQYDCCHADESAQLRAERRRRAASRRYRRMRAGRSPWTMALSTPVMSG